MQLGKPLKKWTVNMISPDYREEERIGTLIQGIDFFLFAPREAGKDTIVYEKAEDVKDVIKLNYGYTNKFTLGSVEHLF